VETGRYTGISVLCGHGSTHVIPVYQGHQVEWAGKSLDFAGAGLIDHLMKLLSTNFIFNATTTAEREILRDIKEKLCFVRARVDESFPTEDAKSYELPDGQVLTIPRQVLSDAIEPLFKPSLLGYEISGSDGGLPELVGDTIRKVSKPDSGLLGLMYRNIVLSGGSTRFPGFCDRLLYELSNGSSTSPPPPPTITPKIIANPERGYGTWIGGSILGTLFSETGGISKEEYDEFGPRIIILKYVH